MIFVVILIFVGPKRLPQIAKSFGKALREFVRAREEVRRTIEKELRIDEGNRSYLEIEGEKGDGRSQNL